MKTMHKWLTILFGALAGSVQSELGYFSEDNAAVIAMGPDGVYHELSCAAASHCENPEKVAAQWIADYALRQESFDVLKVNPLLVAAPPPPTQMGGVYQRLVRDTRKDGESEQDGILRVYNNPLCERVDAYNASAYYEPSYYLAKAFEKGDF